MKIMNIKKFDEKISIFIFNLRNKSYVRKNSLNNKIIKYKDHTTWLKKFLKKKYFLYNSLSRKNDWVHKARIEKKYIHFFLGIRKEISRKRNIKEMSCISN